MDIELAQDKLISKIKLYNKNVDTCIIKKAFQFGFKAHFGQIRSNGDVYFTHPVAVAKILASKKMDTPSIITALLHDTIEDTDVTFEDVKREFGIEVANLVNGVTKLTSLEFKDQQMKQAENFRKLLLAMSDDIRVLLIKLADRLHNIRTLHYIKKPEKQVRIANETMEIYAPLAERIGIRDWREELEDTCFSYINPSARKSILKRLDYLTKDKNDKIVNSVVEELKKTCIQNKLDCEISGRRKTVFSIWKKMRKKEVTFEQLSDIMAFRIIVESVEDCYRALGIIHGAYRLIPMRFKDYISLPKANGYKSLHTGVFGPAGERVEIQIRTKEMHDFGELGVAAHWNYKQNGSTQVSMKEGRSYRWLRGLLEILDTSCDTGDFMDNTRMEMFTDQVFVFTPSGDRINLPHNSCIIDFAYAIHSNVGDRTVGGKINGRMCPLKTKLHNGDQIEVITGKEININAGWEKFVASGKAKSAIRKYARFIKRDEYKENGRQMLTKAFADSGFELSENNLKSIADKFGYNEVDSLLVNIGDGTRGAYESMFIVYPQARSDAKSKVVEENSIELEKYNKKTQDYSIVGLIDGMSIRFPRCCQAVPNDDIAGVVHTGSGISIHRIECSELTKKEVDSNQILDISWGGSTSNVFTASIEVVIVNRQKAIFELTKIITDEGINIVDFKMLNTTKDFFDVIIEIEVLSVRTIIELMVCLRINDCVISVKRI